eukprot:CAMPEP_0116562646 /NCGR_PEP_ID=MMETSP0397-20121206/12281_1 /TAXON_ID=216820 /ORGANISM="Cyclophora tenuis, Strain ECT3854" /LENGTH=35 /DNA_ID= /DNA_START= /DNA_END= /DNA_ORIENTATION=
MASILRPGARRPLKVLAGGEVNAKGVAGVAIMANI